MKNNWLFTFLLSLFLVSSNETSIAQNTDFKLSDYKNPDYVYQKLDLNFDLNNNLTINKASSNSKTWNVSLNSGAGAAYALFKNSEKTQVELNSVLQAGLGSGWHGYSQNASQNDNNSKWLSYIQDFSISGLKRFYNVQQQFFEVNGSIGSFYNGSSNQNKSITSDGQIFENTNRQKLQNYELTLGLLAGSGRIEQVQDARMAMYLLEDLEKLNRISRKASNEDILALSRIITQLKYKRFFDYRLRKIAEITAIDSFLKTNGISGQADATYFTSLNDNWNYANNPERYSGHRIFAGLETSYYFAKYSRNYTYTDTIFPDEINRQKNAGLYLIAGYKYEKPVSLRWQNSASIKAGLGLRQAITTNDSEGIELSPDDFTRGFPSVNLSAEYGFGYYPNSRTWLTLNWWLLSGWDKEKRGTSKDDSEDFQSSFYVFTGPQFHAYYYLSEKLRLSLNANGEFRFDRQKYNYPVLEGNPDKSTISWWNHNIDAALTYSLF